MLIDEARTCGRPGEQEEAVIDLDDRQALTARRPRRDARRGDRPPGPLPGRLPGGTRCARPAGRRRRDVDPRRGDGRLGGRRRRARGLRLAAAPDPRAGRSRRRAPGHSGIHTLVIASSYSGTTAETLAAFEEAVRRGCRLLAVTSGGELARRAGELELGRVTVPAGYMPRAAFGFLTLGVLGALEAMGVVPAVPDDLDEAVTLMREVIEESRSGRTERDGTPRRTSRGRSATGSRSSGGPRGSARWPRRGGRRSSTRTRRSRRSRPRSRSSTTTRSSGGPPAEARDSR